MSTAERSTPPLLRTANVVGGLVRRVADVPSLDGPSVVAAAVKKTKHYDLGTDEFREPMEVLVDSLRHEARLSPAGRYFARGMVQGALENRLNLQADWTAHPEILKEEIERPLYIVGLPRSGTTILQNLLALDPAHRNLLGWEAARPSPPPERATYETDPRIAASERTAKLLDYLAPDARVVHPVGPQLPTECVTLFNNSFSSLELTTINWVPMFLQWCLRADYRPHYEYYRRQLQLLQWHCPGDRWLLKSPAHLFFLDVLLETFPTACVIQTHRDPVTAVSSYCSLAAMLHRIGSDHVDLQAIGALWPKVWAAGLDRAAAARETSETDRFFDVNYDLLVKDPPAMVRRIYDHFELAFDASMPERMRRFLADQPHHQAGAHRYSPEQFGLDADVEAARFADYRQRFGLRAEHLG